MRHSKRSDLEVKRGEVFTRPFFCCLKNALPVSCFSFYYGVCGRTERQPTDDLRLLRNDIFPGGYCRLWFICCCVISVIGKPALKYPGNQWKYAGSSSCLLLSFFTVCGGLRERTGMKMGQMDVQIPVTGSGLWLF